MNEQCDHAVNTIPGQSFEFGSIPQPEFDARTGPSPVQSLNASFDFVRPFMSEKPLRRSKLSALGARRRCLVYLIPEEEGGFSAIAAELPGVASQGDTEQEALANIREAFQGAIQVYKDDNREVPWLDAPRKPEPGAITRSVFVHG
jgi:predicted RNase H-like HicB family nuclease